jgi:hypothetical protein
LEVSSSKEPYDFTVPSSLISWQIQFSSVLLCADMNCGTLFEKSSTNIIHFFVVLPFVCFHLLDSGNGLCDFSVPSLRLLCLVMFCWPCLPRQGYCV